MDDDVMLTTYDNPYSPFDEFDRWLQYDRYEGQWGTMELLARNVARIDNAEDFDEDEVRKIVINDIVKRNPFGIHIKITKEEGEKLKKLRRNLHFA